MVLEEAAVVSDTFRDDSSPTNDADPYSSMSAPASAGFSNREDFNVDFNKLPKPMPLFGPLLGYTQANLLQNILASAVTMSKVVKRPLTADETQALAFHAAKATAIASWGFPIGATGGLWRASNTRSTYRFPFWQPDLDKFDPKKLGPLTGARAEFGWQFLRRFSYAGFGGWVGKILFGTYAATVAATGTRMDSRMKDIVETLRALGNEEAMRRTRTASSGGGNATLERPHGQDASASYGIAEPLNEGMTETSGANDAVWSDRQMRREEFRQRTNVGKSGNAQSNTSTSQMDKVASQPNGFDFDDASPTAGSEAPSGRKEMTAWERLRKGQSPAPFQSRNERITRSQSGSAGDSFSFSNSEEERQLAKSQAQKDFDAKLERERRGQDFDDDRKWR